MKTNILRVAVCDDEAAVCGDIEQMVIDYGRSHNQLISCEVLLSGEDLLQFLINEEQPVDLLFLDIELVQMNGIEVGKFIRTDLHNDYMNIVFISCQESYYRELFEIRPMNFINKPVERDKVFSCIDTAVRLFGYQNYIFRYQINRVSYSIPVKKISYFLSEGRKVIMDTEQGEITVSFQLNEVLEELRDYNFVRVHKAYLVNMAKIDHIQGSWIVLKNRVEIPVGRKYKKDIWERL